MISQLARREVARVLLGHERNRTHTAEALGISRRTLLNYLNEHGLRIPSGRLELIANETDEAVRSRVIEALNAASPEDDSDVAEPEAILDSAAAEVAESDVSAAE
jgi:predicted transcriptional regulator